MNQISLFDQTAPHNRTETSIEAAIEIQEHIGPLQELVLNAINKSSNGMTRDELSVELEIPTATICGRCNEIVKMGMSIRSNKPGHAGKRKLGQFPTGLAIKYNGIEK